MKRVSKERREYLICRQRQIDRYERKKARRTKRARDEVEKTIVMRAPFEFSLFNEKPRGHLLRFVRALRQTVVTDNKAVTIDFSETRRMWSEGVLLFRAALCRILRLTERKVPIRCISPRSNKVSQVLKQVGVYRLLRHRSNVIPTRDDVVNWRVASGSGVEGAKYDEILGYYDGVIPSRLAQGLYRALTEAMTNCHHHAYLWQRADGLNADDRGQDWWMFSQERDGKLSVVFCDLGVGIPATVPKTRPALWKKILALGHTSDGDVIKDAVEDSRTRTGKHYRGKGLRQLTEAIERSQGSMLSIYSNRGRFTYRHGGQTATQDFADTILGTLIQWTVPVEMYGS